MEDLTGLQNILRFISGATEFVNCIGIALSVFFIKLRADLSIHENLMLITSMKKIYLLAVGFLFTSTGFSQRNAAQVAKFDFGQTFQVDDGEVIFSRPDDVSGYRGGTAFWSEDFSNGLAGTNGAWTQGGADQIWKAMNSPSPSNGEWSDNTPDFASTTVANGYVNFDGDSVNLPVSPNYIDKSGWLMSPVIDCSNQSSVLVSFEQMVRWCCTQLSITLGVTTDGGATWTDYDVLNGLSGNDPSPNPELVEVNISSVAAGNANVQLRWYWQNESHYFWAIDDIHVSPAPQNDLVVVDGFTAMENGLEYSSIPVHQVHQMDYSVWVLNQGSAPQTGATLNVNVTGASTGAAFSGTSAGQAIAVGAQSDSIGVTGNTISAKDDYTISMNVTQNENEEAPENNAWPDVHFSVVDSVMARHDGSTTGNYDNQGVPFECGPAMDIYQDDFITSISFTPGSNTVANTLVYGAVYLLNETGFVYQNQTADFPVSNIGGTMVLPFSSPVPVTAGNTYLVAIGHYGGLEDVALAIGGVADAQTVYILDGSDNTWYYILSNVVVNMNLNRFLGVEDVSGSDVKVGHCFPNPTNAFSTLNFELKEAEHVKVELFDLNGKVITTAANGHKAAGSHSIKFDLRELNTGVYYYTLSTGSQRITNKIVLVD